MTIRDAKKIINCAIRAGRPVYLIGTPGIGKTSAVRQCAEELDMGIKIFEGVSIDATDVRGVLVPENGRSKFTISALMPRPEDGSKGILLIDDMSAANRDTQVALHALFIDRRLGEHRLPDGWYLCATGNYASDRAGANPLSTALLDRLVLLQVTSDADVWIEDFAVPKKLHPYVISFIRWKPDKLDTFKQRGKVSDIKDFATPRSYEVASDMLYSLEKDLYDISPALLYEVFSGILGQAIAIEFTTFYESKSRIFALAESVFKGEMPVPDDFSLSLAFCSMLTAKCNSGSAEDKLDKITTVLNYILHSKLPREFKVLILKDLHKTDRSTLVKAQNIRAILNEFADLLEILR